VKKKGDLMILKGKEVAKKIQESIAEVTQKEKIALAILAIGENKSADAYIKGVLRTSEKLGVEVKLMRLPMDISTERVINHIEKINNDDSINGLMIQMPLQQRLLVLTNTLPYRIPTLPILVLYRLMKPLLLKVRSALMWLMISLMSIWYSLNWK